MGEEEKEIGQLYKNLLYLFLICWLVYPILFIVGHNGGVLEPSTYLEIVTVPLEIVAKGIAGIVVRPARFPAVHPRVISPAPRMLNMLYFLSCARRFP